MSTIDPGLPPSTHSTASTPPKANNADLMAMLSAPGSQPAPSKPVKWTPWPRLPATLMRTPQGVEVRTSRLTESQRVVYDRLCQSLGSAQRVNQALTLMGAEGIDALGGKFPDLSLDNLAGLSVLSNGLGPEIVLHDATHALLGNKNNIPYAVSEFEEGVGNAIVSGFIAKPNGAYGALSVSSGQDGEPKLAIDPTKLDAVSSAFNETMASGTSRLKNSFAGSIRKNSAPRVDAAFKSALKSSSRQKSVEARANEFIKQLQLRGQLPPNTNLDLAAKLKGIYKNYENVMLGKTPWQLKKPLSSKLNMVVTSLLEKKSLDAFESIPLSKKFQLYADGIAMVLAVNSAYPSRVDVPSETSKGLFESQWLNQPTDAANFADKGFVRKFLAIRKQVREALGVGAKGTAEPQTAAQTASGTTQQPAKPSNTHPSAQPAPSSATQPENEPAPDPAASPGNPQGSSQGGRVQQPDPRPRPTLGDLRRASGIWPDAKPLDNPRGGLLHPPSEPHKPERLGGYRLPDPNRRPTHTGNTLPKPVFNPNLPGFPLLPEGFKAPTKKPLDSPTTVPTGESTAASLRGMNPTQQPKSNLQARRTNAQVGTGAAYVPPPPARTAYPGRTVLETDRPPASRPSRRVTQAPAPVGRTRAGSATTPSPPPEVTKTSVRGPTGPAGRGTASQLYDQIESIKREAQHLSNQGQASAEQVKRVVGELNRTAIELRKNAPGWIDQLPAAAQGAARQALGKAQSELDSFLRDFPQNAANTAEAISGPLTAVLTGILAFLSVAASLASS